MEFLTLLYSQLEMKYMKDGTTILEILEKNTLTDTIGSTEQ